MTEIQSYPYDLATSPLFIDKFNLSYSQADFDGTAKFELVISSDCPDNVGDCINTNGLLKNTVNVDVTGDMKLSVERDGEGDGYTRNIHILLAEGCEIPLSEDILLKGAFLRKKSNGFVIAFMIEETPIRYCENIIFEEGNVLFKIIR